MKFLHLAENVPNPRLWAPPFRTALSDLVELEIVSNAGTLVEDDRLAQMRTADVVVTGWGSVSVPPALAVDPGRVRWICHVTGSVQGFIPLEIIESGIPVTNWGDAPAFMVAEGAMALLLAVLKDLHAHIALKREGGWALDMGQHGGTLRNTVVAVYGCGAIGRRFVELLRPFGSVIRVFDPYIPDVPEGCERASTLEELVEGAQVLVIHAGLNHETRGSVTAEILARLPLHGVVINTARGGIVDQEALFAELESGRLRAGLDVLEPEVLPAEHPARHWPNVIFSAHQIEREWPSKGDVPTDLLPMHEVCLENVRRFLDGRELRFRMDRRRYMLST